MFKFFKSKDVIDEIDFDADMSMASIVESVPPEPTTQELFDMLIERLDSIESKINKLSK